MLPEVGSNIVNVVEAGEGRRVASDFLIEM